MFFTTSHVFFFHVGIYMFFAVFVKEKIVAKCKPQGCVCRRKGLSLNLKVSGLLI